jgi:hypothetical protein
MAILTNSYADTGEVAALVPRYANGSSPSVFDTTTRPTLLQVESLIDQVSAIVNIILSQNNVTIPVTQTDVKLALDMFVNDEVAAIAEGINGSGRFGPTTKEPGRSRFVMITDDFRDFIENNTLGLSTLGATVAGVTLGYLDTDNSGDEVFPLFQVEGYGNSPTEWDAD